MIQILGNTTFCKIKILMKELFPWHHYFLIKKFCFSNEVDNCVKNIGITYMFGIDIFAKWK